MAREARPTEVSLTIEYLREFKRVAEQKWELTKLNPLLYGFQFQSGTRWNPGLSAQEIFEYEQSVGITFPFDLRTFFGELNGTDLPTINVYGNSGVPLATSIGVYSFPRDIERVRDRIADVEENRSEINADLSAQGFGLLPDDAKLMPIYGHRYVVCTPDRASSVVLSVVVRDVDAIVFAPSLQEWLEIEFLRKTALRNPVV
jgi:hypothetical protein